MHRQPPGQPILSHIAKRLPTEPVANLLQPQRVIGIGQVKRRQRPPITRCPCAAQQ